MAICDTCHFRAYGRDGFPAEPKMYSNGKPYGCTNIGCDGWHGWLENGKAPVQCEGYVKQGEYKPSGVWAAFAGVLDKIQDEVEKEDKEEANDENPG